MPEFNPPPSLRESFTANANQEKERLAEKIAEAQERLMTVSYDKAATYTTVIIFGGYAGFFAVWQLTKEYLSKPQALWSALFIVISLLTFVMFEVAKMVVVTRSVLAGLKPLQKPEVKRDPQKLLAALQNLDMVQSRRSRGFIVVWAVNVAICVLSALGGVGVLVYSFISGLAK